MASNSDGLILIDKNTVAKVDRRYWNVASTNSIELSTMYSIGMWDIVNQEAIGVPNLDPVNKGKGRGSPWFQFPTPPQSYEISEPFANTIVATQDGGKFVESHGSIFKDIRIAGTTGVRPNPVSSNLLDASIAGSSLTISTPQTVLRYTKDERGLNPKEITGYDDIIFLRNIFRAYADIKRNKPDLARRIVMIWKYAKESEIYIVEPVSFTTSRDSSNPLGYTYNISLRALYRFDQTIKLERDDLRTIKSLSGALAFVNQGLSDIAVSLEQLGSAIEFLAQLPFNVADRLVSGALSVFSALTKIRNIGQRLDEVTQLGLKRLISQGREFEELAKAWKSGQNRGDKTVFSKELPRSPEGIPEIPEEDSLSIQRDPAIKASQRLQRTYASMLSQDFLFSKPKQITVLDYSKAYDVDNQKVFSSGTPLNPSNINIPSSVSEDTIKGDESIQDLALRTMGDKSYWKTIAILNNLKPPYISVTEGDGILTPGSKILIPKIGGTGDLTNVYDSVNPDARSENLSDIARKYGRDLKLTNSSNGSDFADLVVSQNGDIDVVDDVANIYQAIQIKLSTEQKELALHPFFGTQYPIGTKIDINRLQDFALNTRATFLSDDRIEDVTELDLKSIEDIVVASAKVVLKQSNSRIPVEFAVRRA